MKKPMKLIKTDLINAYANEGGTNKQCQINNCGGGSINNICRK